MLDGAPNFEAARRTRQQVEEYCTVQRHPSLQRFDVHGPYTLDEFWKSGVSEKPGVYVIYGEDGSIRYIGMSQTRVGGRIA
jgi:hypothetical protein